MKNIKKITKNKKNYLILFDDGEELIASERVIIDFLLNPNKKLDISTYDELKAKNYYYLLLDKMIESLLKKRMLEKDVRAKLSKEPKVLVDELIDELKKLRLIDDESYLKALVREKQVVNRYGKNKIASLVSTKTNDLSVLDNYDESQERVNLEKIIMQELKSPKKGSKKNYFLKLKQSLVNKGFELSLVEELLNKYELDLLDNVLEKDSLAKDYEKYAKKYQGIKLTQKLYQLGYNIEDIKQMEDKI